MGLTLLLTAAAMVLDLFAPWSVVYGNHEPLAHVGAPAFVLALLVAVAALPLAQPALRRRPLVAVCPLVVGGGAIGIGLMYYVLLARENTQAGPQPGWYSSVPLAASQSLATQGPVITPDFGLYLFLLGGAVLVVAGYQLFLSAAQAQPAAAHVSAKAFENAVSNPIPTVATPSTNAPKTPAQKPALSAPPATERAADTQAASTPAIPLPGSASWTEAPQLPTFQRPSSQRGAWGNAIRR